MGAREHVAQSPTIGQNRAAPWPTRAWPEGLARQTPSLPWHPLEGKRHVSWSSPETPAQGPAIIAVGGQTAACPAELRGMLQKRPACDARRLEYSNAASDVFPQTGKCDWEVSCECRRKEHGAANDSKV